MLYAIDLARQGYSEYRTSKNLSCTFFAFLSIMMTSIMKNKQ